MTKFQLQITEFVSDSGLTIPQIIRSAAAGGGGVLTREASTTTLPYPYKANVVDANGLPPVRSNLNSGQLDANHAKNIQHRV